jgi:RHS repeat-associated protein
MINRSGIRTATFFLLVLWAAAAVAAPESRSQYMVVLKAAKNGHRNLPPADVAGMGGQIDFVTADRIVVTLPDAAADALRKHDAVKYIQKLIVGTGASATSSQRFPSILRIDAQAKTLRPQPEGALVWSSGTYRYDGSGNIYTIGLAGESNVVAHTYTYDEVSRLKRAVTAGTPGSTEAWTYDPYGNITQYVLNDHSTDVAVVAATNRLPVAAGTPYTYDSMGDLTSDAAASYAYDPLLQMREKDFANGYDNEMYVYTADEERIGVKEASTNTWTWSLRDFSGKVIRQYQSSSLMPTMGWLWVEDYVYHDGRLVGAERVPEEGGRRHFHVDHLGNPRLVTGAQGLEVSHHDFFAFGIDAYPLWQETTNGFDREDPMRFTGHERDFFTSSPPSIPYLDYMHARYYDPNMGRFLSVDPVLGSAPSPQRWNRYAYVENNPIRLIDPKGLDCFAVTISGMGTGPSTCNNEQDGGYQGWFGGVNDTPPAWKKPECNFVCRYLVWGHVTFEPLAQKLAELNCRYSIWSNCNGVVGAPILFGSFAAPEGAEFTLLKKSLASEAQLAEAQQGIGRVIAGAGSSILRDTPRLEAQYGPGIWVKMSTWGFRAADDHLLETHYYKNILTGQVVEFKSTTFLHP